MQENLCREEGDVKIRKLWTKLLKWGEDQPLDAIGLKAPPDVISVIPEEPG